MHESGLTKGLLRATLEAAEREGGGRVKAVGVRLGVLAGISAEHLREHWDEALRGTPAEGARLEVTQGEDPADDHALDVLLEWVEVMAPGQG